MGILGMIGIGVGALNCYFGLKILNFLAKLYAGTTFMFIGILIGAVLDSVAIGACGALGGFIFGLCFGDKIKKYIISFSTGASAGLILVGLTFVLGLEGGLSFLLGLAGLIGVTYITFKLFDTIMIMITAVNGAVYAGASSILITGSTFLAFVLGVAMLVTGVIFQYRDRPKGELQAQLYEFKNIKDTIKTPNMSQKNAKVCTKCRKVVDKSKSFCPDCGGECAYPINA